MSSGEPATVLYVAWAPFFSGAERALLVLIDALDRSRHRPVVVLGTDGELAAELRNRQITTTIIPIVYSGIRQLPAWSATLSKFVRVFRTARPALVHSNDVPSYQPAGYAARLLRIPAITHVRFPDSRSGFDWFLKPGFQRALFVSEALRQDAMRHAADLFDGHSEVVHDGVVMLPPAEAAERAELRRELGLPVDRAIVVLAGQVAEVKGIWDYIEAAQILRSAENPVLFAVLGDDLRNDGALRREAEQVVRERGLSDSVCFLGFRPNAQRLIPAFDIVAVPSHIEPLGNATLEAMASARPVVGSRVGGIPEMVVDGVTGTLVPSQDPASLARAIEMLVRDPEKARTFGAAGRQRVRDCFSVEAHARRVQAIYEGILHPQVAPAVT